MKLMKNYKQNGKKSHKDGKNKEKTLISSRHFFLSRKLNNQFISPLFHAFDGFAYTSFLFFLPLFVQIFILYFLKLMNVYAYGLLGI